MAHSCLVYHVFLPLLCYSIIHIYCLTSTSSTSSPFTRSIHHHHFLSCISRQHHRHIFLGIPPVVARSSLANSFFVDSHQRYAFFYISHQLHANYGKSSATTSAQLWGAQRVIGIGIDNTLMRMAWQRRRTLWSHQAPLSLLEAMSSCPTGNTSHLNLKHKCMSQPHLPPPLPEANYFPASCQHMFGPLPIPPSSTETSIMLDSGVSEIAFPHNVSFRCTDWVNECIPEDDMGYDVILA